MTAAVRPRQVAIIGGGFCGTMLAVALADHPDLSVTLIERRGAQLGRGVAYRDGAAILRLNIRARNMSAYPDRPADFADWLAARDAGGPDTFAPRALYGTYLTEQLDRARTGNSRLAVVDDAVIDVIPSETTATLRCASGRTIQADACVIAVGNLPPTPIPALAKAGLADGVYRSDPWNPTLTDGLGADDTVLLIGSGLTAVDAALLLTSGASDHPRGFDGSILMVSRRGLDPRVHAAPTPPPEAPGRLAGATPSALLRALRKRVAALGWRAAIDSLRADTATLWSSLSRHHQASLLRHARPYWDVHRHRLAPEIAARRDALVDERRMIRLGGRIIACTATERGARVDILPRGGTAIQSYDVARIVNCTGPASDIARAGDPLLDALLARGAIAPDPLRLGLATDHDGGVRDSQGRRTTGLYCLGPLARSGAWEATAVPELRERCRALADRLVADLTSSQTG